MTEEVKAELKAIIDPIINAACTDVHNDAVELMIKIFKAYPEESIPKDKIIEMLNVIKR